MTESICNNQTALQTMQYNAPAITEFVPSKEQFETLNDLTDLLYPLREFITILGAQHYPTLSYCLPLIHGLLTETIHNTQIKDKDVVALKQHLIPLLKWRFDYMIKDEIFVAATFLDFRFKKMEFLTTVTERKAKIKLAKNFLQNVYLSHILDRPIQTEIATHSNLQICSNKDITKEITKTQNKSRKGLFLL